MKALSAYVLTIAACNMATASVVKRKMLPPETVSIHQLVAKQSAYIKENPQDWHATYTLARIHQLAFMHDVTSLAVYQDRNKGSYSLATRQNIEFGPINARADELAQVELGLVQNPKWDDPKFKQFHKLKKAKLEELKKEGWTPPRKRPEQVLKHYNSSIALFQKVIDVHKKHAIGTLSMASLREQYAKPEHQKRLEEIKEKPKAATKKELSELYYKVYLIGKKMGDKPHQESGSQYCHAAGKAYLRLTPEGKHAAEIKEFMANYKPIPTVRRL